MKSFDELCEELTINKLQPSEADLLLLKGWCEQNISRDHQYSGSIKDRFLSYKSFYITFVKKVYPYINKTELIIPINEFKGMSSLEMLVESGFGAYIEKLKPSKQHINMTSLSQPLLHLSSIMGFQDTTKVLLKLGASLELKNSQGNTPLLNTLSLPSSYEPSLKERKQAIFIELYQANPPLITLKNKAGNNVLHQMAADDYAQLLERVITRHQELASQPNKMRNYPIHTAITAGHMTVVEKLLPIAGVSQLKNAQKQTALHLAARYGNKEMTELCCQYSLDKNAPDFSLHTPLMLALISGNLSALETLFDNGADPLMTDSSGKTLLHLAVEYPNLACIEYLLSKKVIDINSENNQQKTALDLLDETTTYGQRIKDVLCAQGADHGTSYNGVNP